MAHSSTSVRQSTQILLSNATTPVKSAVTPAQTTNCRQPFSIHGPLAEGTDLFSVDLFLAFWLSLKINCLPQYRRQLPGLLRHRGLFCLHNNIWNPRFSVRRLQHLHFAFRSLHIPPFRTHVNGVPSTYLLRSDPLSRVQGRGPSQRPKLDRGICTDPYCPSSPPAKKRKE